MSDIVLKDKSGVKNTYNNINAINIPDGKGGFVKYSLGGTPLPEYDGTVIIEKAESPLGLKKFNDTLTYIVLSEQPSSTEYYNSNYITITPKNIETGDGSIATFYGFTPLYIVDGVIGVMADVQIGSLRLITPMTNPHGLEGETFEVLSVANDTVAEWLLANTEGVSV